MSVRPLRDAERGHPRRDRARAHERDRVPGGPGRDELVAQLGERAVVELAERVRDRRRADLHDRPHRSAHRHIASTYSNSRPADAHDVTLARTGPRQRLLHAHLAEPDVHVLDRLGIGEVGHGDDPLGRAARGAGTRRRDRARPRTPPPPGGARRSSRARARRRGPRRRARRSGPTIGSSPWWVTAEMHGPSNVNCATSAFVPITSRGPVEQLGPVAAELVEQDPLLLLRRPPVHRREVEQHHQHPRALDVAQEAVAEAAALGRALDEPGDVGEHELVVLEPHDAEVRHERRERVVRDLRLRGADRGDERATCRRWGTR